MFENDYVCIICKKVIHTRVFPSDGVCPECRARQPKMQYTGDTKV